MTEQPGEYRGVEVWTEANRKRRLSEYRREQRRQEWRTFCAGMLLVALLLAAWACVVGLIEWGLSSLGV